MNDQHRFRLLFALLMSLQMSLLMTGWVTVINTGTANHFLARWGHAFLLAWPFAFGVVLVSAPAVQALTRRLLAQNGKAQEQAG